MSKKDRSKKKSARIEAEKVRKETDLIVKRLKKEPIAGKQNRFKDK